MTIYDFISIKKKHLLFCSLVAIHPLDIPSHLNESLATNYHYVKDNQNSLVLFV